MKIQQITLLLITGMAIQNIQALGETAEFERLGQSGKKPKHIDQEKPKHISQGEEGEQGEEKPGGQKVHTGTYATGGELGEGGPYHPGMVVFHRSVSEPGQQPRQSIHFEATPSPISSRTPSPTPTPLSPVTPTLLGGGLAENQPASDITRRGSRIGSIPLPAAVSTLTGERSSIKNPSLSSVSETSLVPPTEAPKRGSIIGSLGERLRGSITGEGKPLYTIPRRESIIPGKGPAPLKESALIEMRKSRETAQGTHEVIGAEYKKLPKPAQEAAKDEYVNYENTEKQQREAMEAIHGNLQGQMNPENSTVQKQFKEHQEKHAELTGMQHKMMNRLTELASVKPNPVQAALPQQQRLSPPATTPGERRSSTFSEARRLSQHLGPSPIPPRRPSAISVSHQIPTVEPRKISISGSH